MTIFAKGTITVIGCAIVFAIIAIPLALRKVPPNRAYGYRTRRTLSNERIWYEANAHFGRGLFLAAVVSIGVMLALYRLQPVSPQVFMNLSIIVLTAPVLIAIVATALHIRSL